MFGMGWEEIGVCALVGFFVFGPDRLPTVARDAARLLKQLRGMAQGVTDDLRSQLPEASEFGLDKISNLRDLSPKRMVARALFDDEPPLAATPTPPYTAGSDVPVPARVAAGEGMHRPSYVPSSGAPPYDVDAT